MARDSAACARWLWYFALKVARHWIRLVVFRSAAIFKLNLFFACCKSNPHIHLLCVHVALYSLLGNFLILGIVLEQADSFFVYSIWLLLDRFTDLFGHLHLRCALFLFVQVLLLYIFFKLVWCHSHTSPSLGFFVLSYGVRIFTCILHHLENLRPQKHVLDLVLPAVLFIIIDTIIVLDGLRV